MNNKEFIARLAERTAKTQQETKELVERFVQFVGEQLEEERSLQVPDLGTYHVEKKRERIVLNAATKERQLLPPRLQLLFVPSAELQNKIKAQS